MLILESKFVFADLQYRLCLERLKYENIYMCFSSRSGYRPFLNFNPTPCSRKLTFRYNSMLNFIPVSFFFYF